MLTRTGSGTSTSSCLCTRDRTYTLHLHLHPHLHPLARTRTRQLPSAPPSLAPPSVPCAAVLAGRNPVHPVPQIHSWPPVVASVTLQWSPPVHPCSPPGPDQVASVTLQW